MNTNNAPVRNALNSVATTLRQEGWIVTQSEDAITLRTTDSNKARAIESLVAGKVRAFNLIKAALPGRKVFNNRSNGALVWTWRSSSMFGYAAGVKISLTEAENFERMAGVAF
jgi:hypothetical protein